MVRKNFKHMYTDIFIGVLQAYIFGGAKSHGDAYDQRHD